MRALKSSLWATSGGKGGRKSGNPKTIFSQALAAPVLRELCLAKLSTPFIATRVRSDPPPPRPFPPADKPACPAVGVDPLVRTHALTHAHAHAHARMYTI